MRSTVAFLCFLLFTQPVYGFNALAHKVTADIAWQRLDEPTRKAIVDTLRRHPRFDKDFAQKMPSDVDDARWIFWQASTWPDLIRSGDGRAYSHDTWHWVNFPLDPAAALPPSLNLATGIPSDTPVSRWNIDQAIHYSLAVVVSDAPPAEKAIAYCWLMHLVGDAHQPMHSTAYFCQRFPTGCRGGNSIPLVRGDNLHALWDNLLGRQHDANDVKRAVFELAINKQWRIVDLKATPAQWIQESHELAKSFAYDPAILAAVNQPGELTKIMLPDSYMKAAGQHARARVVAAGFRLAEVLNAKPAKRLSYASLADKPFSEAAARPVAAPRNSLAGSSAAAPSESTGYWLNTGTGVRHNASCRNFGTTTKGRACSATEGKPCGVCGG